MKIILRTGASLTNWSVFNERTGYTYIVGLTLNIKTNQI